MRTTLGSPSGWGRLVRAEEAVDGEGEAGRLGDGVALDGGGDRELESRGHGIDPLDRRGEPYPRADWRRGGEASLVQPVVDRLIRVRDVQEVIEQGRRSLSRAGMMESVR